MARHFTENITAGPFVGMRLKEGLRAQEGTSLVRAINELIEANDGLMRLLQEEVLRQTAPSSFPTETRFPLAERARARAIMAVQAFVVKENRIDGATSNVTEEKEKGDGPAAG